ncbi:MAG TPA: hypothetical protein GXX72_07730 [Clostridiaceae bacterium]|nr:hypothetical protein [Clostridiaceae bacterium]
MADKNNLFKNNFEYNRSSDKANDTRDLVLLYGIYLVVIGLIVTIGYWIFKALFF